MRYALLLKIIIIASGRAGTALSGLFLYFLNSLKNRNTELKCELRKLNDKLDELK